MQNLILLVTLVLSVLAGLLGSAAVLSLLLRLMPRRATARSDDAA